MVDSKNKWKAWLYLSPALVLLGIFTLWPIINTLIMAFSDGYGMMTAMSYEFTGEKFEFGFQNFRTAVEWDNFLPSLKNTMILTFITVPLSTVIALLIAVTLNAIKPFRKVLQTIYFLPYVTNSIAIGMVFAAMFDIIGDNIGGAAQDIQSYGMINNIIMAIAGEDAWVNWMSQGSHYPENMAVMIIYIVWNALPFKILILLGALQSVNKQYYDAAKIDGTSKFRTLTRITVPLLSPMIAYVVITGFIGGFKEYSSIVGVFGDEMGPVGADGRLVTIVGYIYDNVKGDSQGAAAAAALILFAIILAVTLVNLQVSKKRVHYA